MEKNIQNITLAVVFAMTSMTVSFAQNKQERENQRKRPSIAKIFKDLDANEDGKISLKEAKGPLKENFKKVDINKDGFVTKKELEEAPKPERRERSRN